MQTTLPLKANQKSTFVASPPDMLLINIPWSDVDVPYCGPAILKGIADSAGYDIRTRDFNIDLKFKFCNGQTRTFENLQDYFLSVPSDRDNKSLIYKYYDYIIDEVSKVNAKHLGISVFSVFSHRAVYELCELIRLRRPDINIVLGGKGLSVIPHLSIANRLTYGQRINQLSHIMVNKKLCDHVILGDAEDAIIKFLSGNMDIDDIYKFNSPEIINLDYPFSNYDDYQMEYYSGVFGRPQLVVVSSKGCVRSCDFCDVGAQFARFQSKDGNRLAEEMIYLANKHGIYEMSAADSILNGNMKELRKTCEVMAEYNQSAAPNQRINWGGNWIARPPGAIKPEFFKIMAAAGVTHLTIGAESGSNHVLEAMNKKTTVEGLYYELEELGKNGIQFLLNSVIAHWSETYENFLEHITMVLKLGPRYADNSFTEMFLGQGFSLLPNTPAADAYADNHLTSTPDSFSFVWYTDKNPDLTVKVRATRVIILYKICQMLHIQIHNHYYSLLNLRNRLIETYDSGIEFIEKHLDRENYKVCPSLALLDNLDDHVNKTLKEYFKTLTLRIKFKAESAYGDPEFLIKIGGQEFFRKQFPTGEHTLEFAIPYTDNINSLNFSIANRGIHDTVVDAQGNILADKKIEFLNVVIDGADVFSNQHFWYHVVKFQNSSGILPTGRPGCFDNDVTIPVTWPFWTGWLAQNGLDNKWRVNHAETEETNSLVNEIVGLINKIPK
tara:strand:- start:11474 stop:13645 length:2172 start_codon:yes stop_codon:yes gene_type:complete